MKKKLLLISFILQIITCALLFMPCVYLYTFNKWTGWGSWKVGKSWGVNFFEDQPFLAIITLFLLIISIVSYILIYCDKKLKYEKYIKLVPIATLVMFIITTIVSISSNAYNGDQYSAYTSLDLYWMFYIIIIILIAVSGISVILYLNKLPKQISPDNININNAADELKKYKELLDDGAISQEEYEKKKKEILNL